MTPFDRSSKKVLYLGTDPTLCKEDWIHYPVIRLVPLTLESPALQHCFSHLQNFSHVLFTSKNAVTFFCSLCQKARINPQEALNKRCLSIGSGTTARLLTFGVVPLAEAPISQQEGMISLLQELSKESSYVLYPRSQRARFLLGEYLQKQEIPHEILDLYQVVFQCPKPIPNLQMIREVIFTSPSTVEGFFQIFSELPPGVQASFQGPITEEAFFQMSKLKHC